MAEPTPVTVPTTVPEPFDDFGDEPFGDFPEQIASVLDDAGRILGVEREASKARNAAPTAYEKTRKAGYSVPSEAAAAAVAAQQAVTAELDLLAAGGAPFEEPESLGVVIGTIGSNSALATASSAIACEAKDTRRAKQLTKYGMGVNRPQTASAKIGSSGKKAKALPPSIYAQDKQLQTKKKQERELRENSARAPFITAKYGVKLPAAVDSVQIGDASAKARARRAALTAAKKVQHNRPFSAGPLRSVGNDNSPAPIWRVNANVQHDVTDPISVSFQDAKRARAVAALKAKEEREKRDPHGYRPQRIDRSKYPSFKAWLDAQAKHDSKIRSAMPGYVEATRIATAKNREKAYLQKVKELSGVPRAPGEEVTEDGNDSSQAAAQAPALNRFIELTETFASTGADQEAMTQTLMDAAADAAREAVEKAASAAAKASLAAVDDDQDAVASIAEGIAEAAYEDEELMKRVSEIETPKGTPKKGKDNFILGQNPRGSPRSLFGPPAFGNDDGSVSEALGLGGGKARKKIEAPPLSAEELVAQKLASMTPEERLAARAKASKGWSGDFTKVFYEGDKIPVWDEKPAEAEPVHSAGGEAEKRDEFDKFLDETNTDKLAVQFIGPNAEELTFQAVHPEAPKEVTEEAERKRKQELLNANGGYKSPGELAAAQAAATAAEGLDPSEPLTVQLVKERLATMGIEFFGKDADDLAFKAVFPEHEVPGKKKSEDDAAKDSNNSKKKELLPPVPLSHVTGSNTLAVQFIGANADKLTKQALGVDDEDVDAEKNPVFSTDAEVQEMANVLPSTPEKEPVTDEHTDQNRVPPFVPVGEPLSVAQEQAWARAEASVPGTTSAAPTTTEANAADLETMNDSVKTVTETVTAAQAADALLAGDDAVAEAFANESFPLESEGGKKHIDAGSGATVPTSLVTPLSDDLVRDAGVAGGTPDFTKDILEQAEAMVQETGAETKDEGSS